MRGPLLSGVLGSSVTLARLAQLLRGRTPVVVLSSLWLATTLAAELPVVGLLRPADRTAGRRALRKARASSGSAAPRRLELVMIGGAMPLPPGGVNALVLEDLADGASLTPRPTTAATVKASVTTTAPLIAELKALVKLLARDGLLVTADRSKDPRIEAALAGAFLAAGLQDIRQDRPKDGALITSGRTPHPLILAAMSTADTVPPRV